MSEIISFDQIGVTQLELPIVKKTGKTMYSKMTYNNNYTYIKGCKLTLGSPISEYNGYYHLDCKLFDNNQTHQQFKQLVESTDKQSIACIYNDYNQWFNPPLPDDIDPDFTALEEMYIPSIKRSLMYTDRSSFLIKSKVSETGIYDQYGTPISAGCLKSGYTIIPLYNFPLVVKTDTYIHIRWTISQIMGIIPDNLLDTCHLTDIDSDNVSVCDVSQDDQSDEVI